ncbi:MAG: hypothetical protein CMJ49_13035, partial [Planctomycetaceae bacterium]|nr:hypothetical protein [Planctomycetaceae bacterium]
EWVTRYDDALNAEALGRVVRETAFFVAEIKSRYPRGHGRFMSAGSWALVHEGALNPRVAYVGGWMDPARWGVANPGRDVWVDEWMYEIAVDDGAIGITQQLDDDGAPILTPVYRIDYFAFGGVNVGPIVEVRNPHAGFTDRTGQNAPAPVYLDQARSAIDASGRWPTLGVLAVVQEPDDALMWPSRFAGGKPYAFNVAVAEAEVFNNHSWDLWTQMWHAQLKPVERLASSGGSGRTWLNVLDDDIVDGAFDPSIDPADGLAEYLTSLEDYSAVVMEPAP